MPGPKPKRLDPKLTAPDPSLRDPSSQFLQGFLRNPQSVTQGLLPSSLQQMPGNAQSAFNTGNPFIQNLLRQTPGQGVLDAATPIFQRNLQQGADTLRQAGPRFASNTERLVGQQGQQAMQDFNLFSQQVMQEGLNQQLQGLDILGGLGTSADQTALGFGQNQASFLGPLLQQFFGTSFAAGGMTQPGTVTQAQPWWQQLLNAGSQVAGIVGSLKRKPGATPQQGSATPTVISGGSPFGTTSLPQSTNMQNPRGANPFRNPFGTF